MVDRIAEIWWCEDHRSGLGGENEPKVCDEGNRQGMRRCRLVKRMLLGSDALIIRRDENGEWPEAVIGRLVGPSPNRRHRMRSVFDALASSQGVEPQ